MSNWIINKDLIALHLISKRLSVPLRNNQVLLKFDNEISKLSIWLKLGNCVVIKSKNFPNIIWPLWVEENKFRKCNSEVNKLRYIGINTNEG